MSHNSFDIKEQDGKFFCASHNFPEIIGEGEDEARAIREMDKKIIYYKDNYPQQYAQRIRGYLKAGFRCGCGEKLDSPVITIVERLV